MIGIDTNVLIRILLRDDPKQLAQARALMQTLSPEEPAWLGIAGLLEIVWVLTKKLRLNREGVADVVNNLLLLNSLVIEQSGTVAKALHRFRHGRAEFADCLIAASAHAAGCTKVFTFDEVAARDAGMDLLIA